MSHFFDSNVLVHAFDATQGMRHRVADAVAHSLEVFRRERVVSADTDSVLRAFALAQRHQLSPWDALIVQAALDARCTTLLTEDLQLCMRFGALQAVNPFGLAAHEPPA